MVAYAAIAVCHVAEDRYRLRSIELALASVKSKKLLLRLPKQIATLIVFLRSTNFCLFVENKSAPFRGKL